MFTVQESIGLTKGSGAQPLYITVQSGEGDYHIIALPCSRREVVIKFSLSLLPFTLPLKWTKIPGKHKLSFISAAFLSSKEKWSKG